MALACAVDCDAFSNVSDPDRTIRLLVYMCALDCSQGGREEEDSVVNNIDRVVAFHAAASAICNTIIQVMRKIGSCAPSTVG